jgi:3-phosphoshikimate 1-carboxyvinyltransferase
MAPVRTIRPVRGPLDAVVAVPPSKSIANRALVCAALAGGPSTILGVAPGDDTGAMLECLDRLGIGVGGVDEDGSLTVQGTGGELARGPLRLPARLAGTTSRFVTALAALGPGPYVVDGEPPLRARPMAPLHDALAALGAGIEAGETWGHLPVTVSRGALSGGTVALPGDVSSQYVSALMMIAPLLDGGLRIELTSPMVSRPYVEMTAAVMASFGIHGIEVLERLVAVPPGTYRPTIYAVEPDASSASYPLAAAAIVGGRVEVLGLGSDSLQGDARFAALLARMGCWARVDPWRTVVERDEEALRGIEVDMVAMSDLVPTLAVVAAFASGTTRISGVGFIRGKESDRLGDLAGELTRLGASVEVEPDGLAVHGGVPLHGGRIDTHHDHRLAMAVALAGLVVPGVEIDAPDVVSKSWPGYWEALDALSGQ